MSVTIMAVQVIPLIIPEFWHTFLLSLSYSSSPLPCCLILQTVVRVILLCLLFAPLGVVKLLSLQLCAPEH